MCARVGAGSRACCYLDLHSPPSGAGSTCSSRAEGVRAQVRAGSRTCCYWDLHSPLVALVVPVVAGPKVCARGLGWVRGRAGIGICTHSRASGAGRRGFARPGEGGFADLLLLGFALAR